MGPVAEVMALAEREPAAGKAAPVVSVVEHSPKGGRNGPGAGDMLQFMDRAQIFTYALVNTLYIPCIATVAVLAKELGWRRALLISGFTIVLALLAGGIAHRLIALAVR